MGIPAEVIGGDSKVLEGSDGRFLRPLFLVSTGLRQTPTGPINAVSNASHQQTRRSLSELIFAFEGF